MKIILSAESTIDLPKEIIEKMGIPQIHFTIERGGEVFRDDKYSVGELFEYTEKTGKMCHTSAPNVGEYKVFFNDLLKEYDQIIHFTISSKLSSSYSNACIAAEGNPNIKIIDSRSTSGTIAGLFFYAKEMLEAGYTAEEIYNEIIKRREHTATSFLITDLKYLHKGGRCSGLGYLASKILSLRPVIRTAEDGSFKVWKTYRGDTQKCIYKSVRDSLKQHDNIDKTNAFINISTCDQETINGVRDILKEFGFENIYLGIASPVNAYHAGPGVVGVQFLYDGKHEVVPKKHKSLKDSFSLIRSLKPIQTID